MTENEKRIVARRKKILAAAECVFGSKGYAAATVDEIARQAGISKGSIYNYFESKQELFAELFLQAVLDDEAQIEELVRQDMPAREKFDQFLQLMFHRFTKYEHLGRLVLEFWSTAAAEGGEGPFAKAFHQMYERYRARIVDLFEQGQAEGDFVLEYGADVSASLFVAAMDGMSLQTLLNVRPPWTDTEFSAFQQAVMDALVAGKQRLETTEQ